jgi:inositol-phosphate phosphatase / L-galactose 1-phosphate phosphatase / histidinol-phosphatase
MSFLCPEDLIALAHELADEAHPIAQFYFRNDKLIVENKSDQSPVTIADRLIEEKWREIIMERRPQDAIWGEEFGRHNEEAEYTWIVDPIDGTKAFTLGRATFGCMIGLHHKTQGFILGIVDQPTLNLRWFGARGHGSSLNGKKLRASAPEKFEDIRMSFTNPLRLTPDLRALHDTLGEETSFIAYGGDCLNYVGLADGALHVYFDSTQKIYDIAAAIPIIEEAGGKITHKDGTPIDLTWDHTILAACTVELHDDILARLKTITAEIK